jgi:hypothetical protein
VTTAPFAGEVKLTVGGGPPPLELALEVELEFDLELEHAASARKETPAA